MAHDRAGEIWQLGTGDMPVSEFRAYGHEVVDWIAEYLEHPQAYPVMSTARPGDIRAELPLAAPGHGESMHDILVDFQRIVMPGITHWNHPAFFAYFSITGSAPGILGEMLAAALNVNGMLWRTSPAATELEEVVLEWLRQLIALPDDFQGIIYDTASISTLVAVAAAREAAALDIRVRGMSGRSDLPLLRLYCSDQAHSSVEKAAITLGLGQNSVRKVGTDSNFKVDVAAMEQAIQDDIAGGIRPFCIVACAGTTSTTSIDPIPAIAALCKRYGIWLHVDAAYAGAAAIVPELRWVLDGAEFADSLVINPHKWLFTPIDASVLYCRRLDVVRQAFALVPEYLQTSDDGAVRNYMDYGPQLGRRFRALKLWFVLRSFGREGIETRIREHVRLAAQFADWVDAAPDWELLAPVPLSTVCFRFAPAEMDPASLDQRNVAILDQVNATGEIFLSHTRLRDVYTLRLAIGNARTSEHHVRRAWELLQAVATQPVS